MGSSRHKAEFPPLLQPGLHEMSVDDLKAMVVDGFPLSTRRGTLWGNLVQILERLKALKIPCKIWVDGSFLTKKIDPDDVDFVIDLPVAISDNPTPAQESFLNQLAGLAFCRVERMHSFLMFDAPVMHTEYALSQALHAQWKKDFGFSYVSKESKGIAVLMVQP